MEQQARQLRRLLGTTTTRRLPTHPLPRKLRRESLLGKRQRVAPRRRRGSMGRREKLLRPWSKFLQEQQRLLALYPDDLEPELQNWVC
ncbi:hypothetical protein LINPERPRIM_LOCUS36724 [Linum perenne]